VLFDPFPGRVLPCTRSERVVHEEVVMATGDRTYRCLNPSGIELPVKTFPLARRLDKIDGKTIHFSICGEPDITIALEKRLKMDYPNVNWTTKKSYTPNPVRLSEEEMKTTDAVILGVCW
jgi:hypothetical protein